MSEDKKTLEVELKILTNQVNALRREISEK